jgi:hypothetical protein
MRTALLCLMSFGVAWVVPQLPGLTGNGQIPAVKASSVEAYLELDASQQKKLEDLSARLRTKADGSMRELEEKQKALRMQLASENADALAAGRALLALELAKHKAEKTSEEMRQEALTVLNEDQRAKLQVLEQAEKLHPLAKQAMGLFLLAPPDAVVTGTGPLGMFPARKLRIAKPEGASAT